MYVSIYKHQKMFQEAIIILLAASSVSAIVTTVCDCSKPITRGIIQFADGNCEANTETPPTTFVKYEVYTEQREAVKFPAFVCGRWKMIKHITVTFFGNIVVVPERIAMDTTPAECQIMQQSLRCGEQPMTNSDNKWTYNDSPSEDGYWLRTTTVFVINCMFEEITLIQEKESGIIETPLGTANATTGTLSHNHLTVIWDAKYTTAVDHKPRLLETGYGNLTQIAEKNK